MVESLGLEARWSLAKLIVRFYRYGIDSMYLTGVHSADMKCVQKRELGLHQVLCRFN